MASLSSFRAFAQPHTTAWREDVFRRSDWGIAPQCGVVVYVFATTEHGKYSNNRNYRCQQRDHHKECPASYTNAKGRPFSRKTNGGTARLADPRLQISGRTAIIAQEKINHLGGSGKP